MTAGWRLSNYYQSRYYPAPLRFVTVVNTESGDQITFMTNNFTVPGHVVAPLLAAERNRISVSDYQRNLLRPGRKKMWGSFRKVAAR